MEPLTSHELEGLVETLKNSLDDKNRLVRVRAVVHNHSVSASQIATIVSNQENTWGSLDGQLEAAKLLISVCSDPENIREQVLYSFKYSEDREALEQLIPNH